MKQPLAQVEISDITKQFIFQSYISWEYIQIDESDQTQSVIYDEDFVRKVVRNDGVSEVEEVGCPHLLDHLDLDLRN